MRRKDFYQKPPFVCAETIIENHKLLLDIIDGNKPFLIEEIKKMQLESLYSIGALSHNLNNAKSSIEILSSNKYDFADLLASTFSLFTIGINNQQILFASIFIDVFIKNFNSLARVLQDVEKLRKTTYSSLKSNFQSFDDLVLKISFLGVFIGVLSDSSSVENFVDRLWENTRDKSEISGIAYSLFLVAFGASTVVSRKFSLNFMDLIDKYYLSLIKKMDFKDTNYEIAKLLFDSICRNLMMLTERDNDKIIHYTNKTSLEKILLSNQIKFSHPEILNDKDEGQLLDITGSLSVRTLSFTTKQDSIDLWGNYTKFDGVNLVFNKNLLLSIERFVSKDKGIWAILSSEGGFVQYGEKMIGVFLKYLNNAKLLLSLKYPSCKLQIEKALYDTKDIWRWLFKKKAWSYEEEIRLIVTDVLFKAISESRMHPINYSIINDDLFIKFPKELLEEIKLAPYLKHSSVYEKGLREFLDLNGYKHVKITYSEANIQKM